MPIGKRFPKLSGRVEVHFGKPLSFERFFGQEADRFVLRSITDEVMYEIMMLSGQEYVDEYASKVKARLAEAEQTSEHPAPDGGSSPAESESAEHTRLTNA